MLFVHHLLSPDAQGEFLTKPETFAAEQLAIQEEIQEGIILRASNGVYTVQNLSDNSSPASIYRCSLRGNLLKEFQYSSSESLPRRVVEAKRPVKSDSAAVGDRVSFLSSDNGTGTIVDVHPRATRFARSGFRGRDQTIISNLDQLVIVFSCADPRPDLWKIDRWLVSAESFGLEPLIVANKRDLVDSSVYLNYFDEYIKIGYRVIPASALTLEGLDELNKALKNRISAFTGPSGVGKSSLLNCIDPGLNLATADIGSVTHKGRHTTTARQLISLKNGGWVADTPGLRQLNLHPMDRNEIADCFLELRHAVEKGCRFPNCMHETEPECSIKQVFEQGLITERRFQSFLSLVREMQKQ